MEIHEEFRIKISSSVRSWCYYPPLDVIIYESGGSVTIIEAATGCVNGIFYLHDSIDATPICIDLIGKQKLAMARGNVFNCRSKFNDVLLVDSMLRVGSADSNENACIDLPLPEAEMLLEALRGVRDRWDARGSTGFQCSIDCEAEDGGGRDGGVCKWSLATFQCPPGLLTSWLSDVTAPSANAAPDGTITSASSDSPPFLPLIASVQHRLSSLQSQELEARIAIHDRRKDVMNIEANRFLSFETWPHTTYKWATPELMSKVGFYHHPRRTSDDRALCFLCNICLITWEATDEPWSEHQRHSPNCPLFKHNYTRNVPLSVTEATTTAQRQNSPNNITLIAKSTSNRYVATVSEDGHICIWDTCYLFRKIAEFDTPILSTDGSIAIDSACLIDNGLLLKPPQPSNEDAVDERSLGFHLVLGARLVPDHGLVGRYLHEPEQRCLEDMGDGQTGAFLVVLEVACERGGLLSQEERLTEFGVGGGGGGGGVEDYRLTMEDMDVPYEEGASDTQEYLQLQHIQVSSDQEPLVIAEDRQSGNASIKQAFLSSLGLLSLWAESKAVGDVAVRARDLGNTSVVHIVPLSVTDVMEEGLSVSSLLPIVTEVDEEAYEACEPAASSSTVYIIANVHREGSSDACFVGGALFSYRCQVDAVAKEAGFKPRVRLQEVSQLYLPRGDNIETVFPISFESLESNCSESSSTANVDEVAPEPLPALKSKSAFYWLLLTTSSELHLCTVPLHSVAAAVARQPLSEAATRIPIRKELPGRIARLLLFSDMDRLCLLTADGVMAFYTVVPRKKADGGHKEALEQGEKPYEAVPARGPRAHVASMVPEPLIVEQEDVVERLGLLHDFVQYDVVTSRLKLTYGCNWVEVSPLEIIDFKTNVTNSFINVPRRFSSKSASCLLSEPPSSAYHLKAADQQQCCTRTLNFRASQACSREQIVEFSTAKQLCLGHVDLRFELYDRMHKGSNLIYVTLLRQQKFNGSAPSSKDQANGAGSIKVNTSKESNVIINDLEAPFIDDDLAQYYDEVNVENLRKLDGEIVAGPYLLNKYCHSESTSVFLSMTSAELLKCRSRHYAIHIRIRCRSSVEERRQSASVSAPADRYSVANSAHLNIKSISLTLRKFSKPFVSVRNERSQRLAILRNHRFLKQLFDVLLEETGSRIPRPLIVQNSLDICNWIVVMYLNDIKPHSEKIHRLISIATEYVYKLIFVHLVQGDRHTSKMASKIVNGLIKLESRYWSIDNRPAVNHESTYFMLSRSVHSILKSNIDWILLATNSVAVHNYLLILNNLDQLFVSQLSPNIDTPSAIPFSSSLGHKLKLLALTSQRYSESMNNEEHIYLKTILGYPHDPLTGDLFDIVTEAHLSEPLNTLHSNLSDMYTSKKPTITIDGSSNDSISKYLMHTFHDHSLQHIQDQINEQISSVEDKVAGDFSIQDLQKVYHKMVMTNVSNNIQLMSPDVYCGQTPPDTKVADLPEQVPPTISNMTWPGFDPFLLSKMNPKQIMYSDMKKKLKSGQSQSAYHELNGPAKTHMATFDQSPYKMGSARRNSLLEVDILPVFFESGSDGTFIETSDSGDQSTKEYQSCNDYSPNMTIPLMHMMEDLAGLPTTPKTTPAITTQTTPMQNSPVQSPSSLVPAGKPEILETSSILLEKINQQRLKFSQHTSTLLTTPSSYYIVVNRLHANARRHVILDLHQLSLITDIIIPSCDKLQKIIVRIGRNKNEEEMQTVVVHSKIASEPLLLLNIQPKIICQFVQIIVIAKLNITATRNRINMGNLYGRAAILPWEIVNEMSIVPSKNWRESISQSLDQLRPQAETVSVRYAMSCATLKHLLSKCLKTGINQRVLSQAMLELHSPKPKLPQSRNNSTLVQLINQVNNAYNKCCQLQHQLTITNNQMRQLQAWMSMSDGDDHGRTALNDTGVDKLRVLVELLLESLLIDKAPCLDASSPEDSMKLISDIMTNVMWFGNREMQIMIVSWVPNFITKSADVPQAIRSWCHDWLLEFLLSTFTNKKTSLLALNKEEIFSFICVIFQRVSNAGYHYQLLRNMLDILIVMMQPHRDPRGDEMCMIDIELLNWMMLLVDFVLTWMDDDAINTGEPFSEWKFLFWNKAYHSVDDETKSTVPDGTKDRLNYLKQTLLQLNSQKEAFVEYTTKSQFDPWFSQLIMNEYLSHYVKLSVKVTNIIAKMKKSLSVSKCKKPAFVAKKDKSSFEIDPLLAATSSSIAVTIKLLLNTLKCMDFRVSQDTFILTCMILNKLFVLGHDSGFCLNDYIEKEAIYSIIKRAFRISTNSTIGLDVYSLHACKLLLSEIVLTDIRTLTSNTGGEPIPDDEVNFEENQSVLETSQDENGPDTDSVYNDDEEDPDNEEEDITPTGADDEDINNHADEPYTFYITHLGNIAKQKGNIKNNEESPDEYVDIVEEFDFLSQPTSFIPKYHKPKFPKEYQSAFKPIELDKPVGINSLDSIRSDKIELDSTQSVLYYDLRLENTIFSHQEIMYNHSFLNWTHQIRMQLYSNAPCVLLVTKVPVTRSVKTQKPVAISFVLESINELFEGDLGDNINLEELVIFVLNICHHLQKEDLLASFDSMELCSISLKYLLDKILQRCSDTLTSLSLYCQMICFLLTFKDYRLEQCHFRRIFQLTDLLQCQELNDDVVNNFRTIITKSLENVGSNSEFFLNILYDIVDNCHRSTGELRASEQLGSVIMEVSRPNLMTSILKTTESFSDFVRKIFTLTDLYLSNPDRVEEQKCFTSLVPRAFTEQLLEIERSLISYVQMSPQSRPSALAQLNLMALDMMTNKPDELMHFTDGNMLQVLFGTLSMCTSNILENSKLSDEHTVAEDLVRHSQDISLGDIVWRQLVTVAQLIIATSTDLTTDLLDSLLSVLQRSLPTINEPLFLVSIWLLKNAHHSDNIDYNQLLTTMISMITSSSDCRLSNTPLNTVTTRLAIAKMRRFNSFYNDQPPTSLERTISNSSRLNVAPYCKIHCHGNDSSDPSLLSRLLTCSSTKSPLSSMRSNKLKQADIYWSYDFFPHEANVELVVTLPCDMIVHKIILHPKSLREFSPKFQLTTVRSTHDTSTTTYQQYHNPVSYNDGILIDSIDSNQLSNRIMFRFQKPVSGKLVMSKMEIFTINQWWDYRFQLSNDVSSLSVFRCLHLFNYLIEIPSPSTMTFVRDTLSQNTKFFSVLLNWNQVSASSSELPEISILNKSICNLIVRMFVHLAQCLEPYSALFLNEILTKVSIRQNRRSGLTNPNVRFTSEISIMELNIFYYILTLDDGHWVSRLRLVLAWFQANVMVDTGSDNDSLVYHDSVAAIVYLLSVVLWHHSSKDVCHDIDPQVVGHIQRSILLADGHLRKALYRLLCSLCAVQPALYRQLIMHHPIINTADDSVNHGNLKSILWASRSTVGCRLLEESGLLVVLTRRVYRLLTEDDPGDLEPHLFCDNLCSILSFLGKLCFGGCRSVKVWLGSAEVSSFWALLIDYLINEGPCVQNLSSVLKMKLIDASVFYFRAVTVCCEHNQLTFVRIFVDSIEKYRLRSDTIILSNCLRSIILGVIVKEPRYCVLVDMTEPNTVFKRFPGWLISSDESGRCRLSFRHPSLGCETNCIMIDTLTMTDTIASIASAISNAVSEQRQSCDHSESLLADASLCDHRTLSKTRPNRPSFSADISMCLSLTYRQKPINRDLDIFDLVTLQESEGDFNRGFLHLSCSVNMQDKVDEAPSFPISRAVNSNYLLVKFTEHGGLTLLSMMMPLLYTDIRRISSISSTCYRPTTTSISNNMGFVDDEIVIPTETSKVVKSLPLIPAHSITALCLFLHIELYPLYLIREHQYRSALIHLLMGVTDDECGVSLIQSHPQLQCLPFTILSDVLQDASIAPDTRAVIVAQCIDLGLIDFFINLLSILGHVDSGLSLSFFKSSGPWASFISQSLCDLHYQLFSPMATVEKTDQKTPVASSNKPPHVFSTSADPKSQYITFMPFIDEKKNYWAKGTGFGTGGMYSTWDSEYVQLRQRLEETNAAAILDTLSTFISPCDDDVDDLKGLLAQNEDLLPLKAVESIYQSTLLTFICCYLRNDSVLDVSQHVNIYKSVLRIIRAMARHRCLHYLLFPHLNPVGTNPDFIRSLTLTSISSVNVSQLLFQLKICVDTYINRLKKAPGANTKTPENTRRLTRQFSIRRKNTNYSSFLQRINDALKTTKDSSANSKEDQKIAESENLTLLLPEIYSTLKLLEDVEADIIERNKKHETENQKLHNTHGTENGNVYGSGEDAVDQSDSVKSIRDIESRYMELMKKLQFGMYEMICPVSDDGGKVKFAIPYHFKKNVENAVTSQSSASSLSRARRLAQETVTLSTSLPLSYSSSVFVRCDENHLDVMKVIIVGPPDTPYANGCFEFDVYFPPDYPKTPPLLNLQTTGNGSVRFNPNLYNEGKVCLSILNTWHGRPEERWSSRTSSFLQVLVSIQSLILVSEPYFNEPGYERSRGTPSGNNASRAYSANIQAATSRWAIFEMMKNPPLCFADVVRKHFLLKKEEILGQLQAWVDVYADPGFDPALLNNTRPSIANSVQNLKKNLVMIKKEFEAMEKEAVSL